MEEWADGKTTILLNYTAGEGFTLRIHAPKQDVYVHAAKSGEEMIHAILDDRRIKLPQTRMSLIAVTAQAAVKI